MYPLSHKSFFKCALVALFVLNAPGPASADDLVENLGPVGPAEPIITSVGSKRVIAFYSEKQNRCALHAVVWDTRTEEAGTLAARIRVGLQPGQIVHIDTAENETLNMQCGDKAKTLALIGNEKRVAFGLTSEQPNRQMKASASDF